MKGLVESSPVSFRHSNNITDLLADHVDFRRMVFGVQTVPKYCIDSFFFQLVASNILRFEKNSKGNVSCVLAKDNTGQCNYEQIRFWSGFEFRSQNKRGDTISYKSLVSRTSFRNYFSNSTTLS